MNDKEYFAQKAVSQSTLKLLRKSPAHARYALDNPKEPSAAMQLGTCLHALVLENKVVYATLPESAKGNSNAAKLIKANFALENAGKIVLSADDAEAVRLMAASVKAHPAASKLLALMIEPEKAIAWQESDLTMKGKIDGLLPFGVLDLKTTTSAEMKEFEKSIFKFGYHIQAAHYLYGAAANDLPAENFYIIAVENEPPYCTAVFVIDHETIEAGEKERQKLIKLYKECMTSGVWPGYSDKIQTVKLPYWALKLINEDENDDY